MKSRLLPKSPAFGVVGLALVAGYFLICGSPGGVNRRVAGLHREDSSSVASLDTLLTLPSSCLIQVDIASMNLLCAEALPGPGGFDLNACLARLDEMAARVRAETGRHAYRFQKNPAEYENSEGFFRMVMLAVVLAEDFGVRYAPGKMGTVAAARADDGFFADARYVFLHGLVRGDVQSPRSKVQSRSLPAPLAPPALALGTCSSLPVLQVAVGRRLGYPLKLVTTKGHLFVRWDDAHEGFNIEAAGQGVNRFSNDYYRHWPLEITPAEEATEGYLKSLTPPEELAVFLSIRGMCLREAGRLPEAAKAFAAAAQFAPACRGYQVMLASLRAREQRPLQAALELHRRP